MFTIIKNFYFKHKRLVIILALVATVIVYVLVTNARKERVEGPLEVSEESPAPEVTSASTNYYTGNSTRAYFINQIVTNIPPVTGYSWSGGRLIYSTKDGIFEAGTNNAIFNKNIQDIVWSENFNGLIKSDNIWEKFDYKNKTAIDLGFDLSSPVINNRGTLVADFLKNKTIIYNLETGNKSEKELSEQVSKIFFLKNGGEIIVFTGFGNNTHVYKLDNNLTEKASIKLEKAYAPNSISSDGTLFTASLSNELIISDFSGVKYKDFFLKGSEISSSFTSDGKIIEVEKYKDSLGRTLDNIYVSNEQGNRVKMSDSKPIINRIDTAIPVGFNSTGSIATFVENGGKIWILALKENLFPTYSTEGELVFSNIESTSH